MKLRIHEQRLRLRLTEGEIRSLKEEGHLCETLRFGSGEQMEFSYAIELLPEREDFGLRYRPGRITLLMGALLCREWEDSGEISFSGEVQTEGGEIISLLVERDLPCRHDRQKEHRLRA